MTVWNLHLLNARHHLTPILSEIRAAAREAVARVSEHADLPRFDLVVGAGREVVPEWGLAGHAPAPGLIEVTLSPARLDPALVLRSLVHQMHHLIRWDGPGYGRSLGEALVSEGLAGHFVLQVLGGQPDPWDAVQPAPGLARQASAAWDRLDYDHARWFAGKGDIRKWAGHGLGHRLVAEYLAQSPDDSAATLVHARAEAFRPAMRRLIGGESAAAEGLEMAPENHVPQDEIASAPDMGSRGDGDAAG